MVWIQTKYEQISPPNQNLPHIYSHRKSYYCCLSPLYPLSSPSIPYSNCRPCCSSSFFLSGRRLPPPSVHTVVRRHPPSARETTIVASLAPAPPCSPSTSLLPGATIHTGESSPARHAALLLHLSPHPSGKLCGE